MNDRLIRVHRRVDKPGEVFIDVSGRSVYVTDDNNQKPLCIATFFRNSEEGDGGATRAIATAEQFWANSAQLYKLGYYAEEDA